jgi:uncharacterized pyridoxal phosphate-dependent enzyme
MGIYGEIGVRPFINAGGWMYTRYGGSIMPAPVVAAMAEASRQFVNIFDLQDRVGQAIAAMTRNEAAFVSCGAASGILLAVATCIAGTDAELADRLPDTVGMRNQVIRSAYARGTEADPAIRAAGGKIVEIGPPDKPAGVDQYLDAINDQTAAILLVAFEGEGGLEASGIVQAARERKVPVLVDGAYALPPKENLWRFTRELGVDVFITSGGKAIRGPQCTGLVLGSRAIVEGCKFHGSPNLRIGRGMKVGKEEFAGIFTALKLFLDADFEALSAHQAAQIGRIAEALQGVPHLTLRIVEGKQLEIDLDADAVGFAADEAARMLLSTDPSILVHGRGNRMIVRTSQLQEGEELIVGRRLKELFTGRLQDGKGKQR